MVDIDSSSAIPRFHPMLEVPNTDKRRGRVVVVAVPLTE